jgi:tripartite-type tricarboxylate transporter receptor subunit TctC
MKLPRRRFLHLAGAALAAPAIARRASAQAYPARPVRWVLGYPAGGSTDILVRIIGNWLTERLGQPFVVENKPGAGTNLAVQAVVNAPPDGYTLLFVATSNAINATSYESLPFNFLRDIAPVAALAELPFVLEVNPSLPAKSVAEFIAYAKANPARSTRPRSAPAQSVTRRASCSR